jgi:hypothetical protein
MPMIPLPPSGDDGSAVHDNMFLGSQNASLVAEPWCIWGKAATAFSKGEVGSLYGESSGTPTFHRYGSGDTAPGTTAFDTNPIYLSKFIATTAFGTNDEGSWVWAGPCQVYVTGAAMPRAGYLMLSAVKGTLMYQPTVMNMEGKRVGYSMETRAAGNRSLVWSFMLPFLK